MRGNLHIYYFSVGAAVLSNAFAMLIPLAIRYAIDTVIAGGEDLSFWWFGWFSRGTLVGTGLLILVVSVARSFFLFQKGYLSAMAAENAAKALKDQVMIHLQHVPFAYFSTHETGDLIQRATSDVETVRRFIAVQLVEITSIISMVMIITTLTIILSPALTIIALILVPLITISAALFFRQIKDHFQEADESEARLTTFIQEYLHGVTIVKAFGREPYEHQRFQLLNDDLRDKVYQLIQRFAVFWSLSDLFCFIQIGLVLFFGTTWVISGQITLGTVVAFLAYENMLLYPVRQLGRVISEFGKATVAEQRLNEILQAPLDEADDGEWEPDIQGEIAFSDVWFAYPDQPDVFILKGLSFHINAGETIGILGPTGSGKSTLAYLITRLYETNQGQIQIDGMDIRQIKKHHLRRNVGLVLQDTFLYARTIAENIAIREPVNRSEIVRAAKAAAIHHNIQRFDADYDTLVGERGVSLSGGQKQRVAIARTLLKPMPVMIFDDSLSAVDTETDQQIRHSMMNASKTATVILISHRITTLMEADRILVIQDGTLEAIGTHGELIQQPGLYQKIWEIQQAVAVEEGGEGDGYGR
jgi:ATP-binding cassette subfamily B protein